MGTLTIRFDNLAMNHCSWMRWVESSEQLAWTGG
jgi:hypothetical protein